MTEDQIQAAVLRQLCNILARCKIVGECWEWQGARRPKGYGVLRLPGTRTNTSPHRFVAELFYGNTAGKVVCHRCDNPPCCNPQHLFVADPVDNVRDCIAKNRHSPPPRGLRGRQARGVSFHSKKQRFSARITIGGRRLHLGYYRYEIDALNAVAAARRAAQ